jgi:hypothetical protein
MTLLWCHNPPAQEKTFMAERLATFDFTAQSAVTSAESKGRNRYPWNDWFDGDIWKITQGEDFDTSPLMMERIIRTRASNKSHKAKVTLRHLPPLNGGPASIVLQRIDVVGPSAAKAVAEAARKAEAAAKRRAKKAAAEEDAVATLRAAGITPKKVLSKRPAKKAPTTRRRAANDEPSEEIIRIRRLGALDVDAYEAATAQ